MRAAALGLAILALLPSAAAAQERQCDIVESGRIEGYGTGDAATVVLHDPFVVRCTDGAELRAQTGTLFQASRELQLVGQVFFQDADRTLTSDEATYQSQVGRLWARGNVVFVNLEEGSTLRGPELEYYRETEDRPVSQVIAVQRPHLTLRSRDAGADEEPLELDADQVVIAGEDELNATGSVVITRSDLTATGETVRYDAETADLDLRGDARIVSEEYALSGDVIRARLPEGGLEYVSAENGSELSSEELTVRAPSIQLFFADDLLQRTVARGSGDETGAGRAVAIAESFRLEADSLDALIPGQRLERVVAIGRAVGERFDSTRVAVADSAALAGDSTPVAGDSAAVAGGRVPLSQRTGAALVQNDWIRGDTVIGVFERADTLALADSAAADSAVVLRMMVAKGGAQSLYRLERGEATDSTGPGFAVNFLSGDTITLSLSGGEVDRAEVQGVRRGLYLEPAPPADDLPPEALPENALPGAPPSGDAPPRDPAAPPGVLG